MLSKAESSTIFWFFGLTQHGIEPRSSGPLANTLLKIRLSVDVIINIWIICSCSCFIFVKGLNHYQDNIIIIIIMSRYQHGYFLLSLATPPNCLLLLGSPQGYILYQHRTAVYRFELGVMPLLVHVKGSTRIHHSWARPYFFSSVPHVWFL